MCSVYRIGSGQCISLIPLSLFLSVGTKKQTPLSLTSVDLISKRKTSPLPSLSGNLLPKQNRTQERAHSDKCVCAHTQGIATKREEGKNWGKDPQTAAINCQKGGKEGRFHLLCTTESLYVCRFVTHTYRSLAQFPRCIF